MTPKSSYENGECPDCGLSIPITAIDGDDCANCGHVFWSLAESHQLGCICADCSGAELTADND